MEFEDKFHCCDKYLVTYHKYFFQPNDFWGSLWWKKNWRVCGHICIGLCVGKQEEGSWDTQKLKYIILEQTVVGKGTNRFNFNYT